MTRNVVVIGGTGFIGRAILEQLSNSVNLTCVHRSGSLLTNRLRDVTYIGLPANDLGTFAEVDLREVLNSVDVVVNAAGLAHAGRGRHVQRLDAYWPSHVLLPSRIVAAIPRSTSGLIHLSSIKAGTAERLPTTVYGVAKRAGEELLMSAATHMSASLTTFRLSPVYGAGSPNAVMTLANLVRIGAPLPVKGIQNVRSFGHVSNVASAVNYAMDQFGPPVVAGLHDGHFVSTEALVRTIARVLEVSPRLATIPHPLRSRLGSLSADHLGPLGRLLGSELPEPLLDGWAPPTSLLVGLRATLAATGGTTNKAGTSI